MISLIKSRLAVLEPLYLEVIDESAAHEGHAGASLGGHFRVVIVSALLESSQIQRHRQVYHCVRDLMAGQIHALAIEALLPHEWHRTM